jgi:23S rRNA (cytosine1962-C5)-methyltransferase
VLPESEWTKLATARFQREQKDKFRFSDDITGGWTRGKSMPESWQVNYEYNELKLGLRLALTSFGHVGIFRNKARTGILFTMPLKVGMHPILRVLNLFAYTGAASVVAKLAGADVTHVDASRPGINWANHNMQLNSVKDIRWVHEDALKFVKREVKAR